MNEITATPEVEASTTPRRPRRLQRIVAPVSRRGPWRSLAAFSLIGAATMLALPSGASLGASLGAAQTADVAHSFTLTPALWTKTTSGPIALSSPIVANLPGGPAVVVGDRSGHVYAMNLSSGAALAGWPVSTGGIPVDSTPSVAAGAGPDSVYVGVGNASNSAVGGYMGISPTGGTEWLTHVQNPSTDTSPATAVIGGLAVGDLENGTDVVSGSLGEETQALNAGSGAILPGYPWFQADSNFTTPALADLYSNGLTEVVEGGDSTAGVAYGQTYSDGGHLRIITPTGNAFTGSPSGGLLCQYNTDQTVQSSPAVGEFLSGNAVGIAFGTGATYSGASTTNDVIAVNTHCGVAWTAKLDGNTTSSPALAQVSPANGPLQVIEGTNNGTVWALNGTNGAPIWHTPVGGQIIGSVVTADLTGAGYQDVIVPTTLGVQILDGESGQIVATVATNMGLQNAPLVTDDGNGTIGLTFAGYNLSDASQGLVEHFEVTNSNGSSVNAVGAWPMFHHDPQLTGDAGTPAVNLQVPCAPPSNPTGYDMTATDGGIFNFGNLPFCGSTGNYPLNAPIVAMATTPDGGGYWTVASDGGIFAFGDAAFYGSMGGHPLVKPIVGMASTPSGKGYWLVASDGGIFAFGDAGFYGSMGGHPLDKPIVAIATTPNGGGYWMVASDGGIFTFGNAKYYGSMGNHPLNKPVVGMAPDDATGGYWLVASDGGIFAFNAPFLGSTGNVDLTKPVVGMQALPNGQGYRFVASDGGIFDFGAPFYGSTGGIRLNKPVVDMAGP